MLTRVFWLLEEQTRYSLKPLLNQYLFPTPSTFARLDYRLRRAVLYPAELRVPAAAIGESVGGCNGICSPCSPKKIVAKFQRIDQRIDLGAGVIEPE